MCAVGKILDVDVVADRRSVAGRIVSTENLDEGVAADGRTQDVGDEVRFRIVILAEARGWRPATLK